MNKLLKNALAVALMAAFTAQAASTGTLQLRGTVSAINDITVTPNGSNNVNIDIEAGESAKNVATVTEVSNNRLGYKINVKSTNGGKLVHTEDNAQFSAYTISYNGGSALTLTTSYQQAKNVTSLTGKTTSNSAVTITVPASANALAGTYEDVVTFQVVAN